MASKVGLELQEGVANVFNLSSNIPVRNIGALVERVRGVANLPTYVTNQKEDQLYFGGHDLSMYSSYVIENLFANLEGAGLQMYEIRIVGTGCVAATGTLENEVTPTPDDVATITAAREGQEDVGTWANYATGGLRVTFLPIGHDDGSDDDITAVVYYNGVEVERLQAGTMDDLEALVNSTSNYFMMTEIDYTKYTNTDAFDVDLAGGVYVAPTENEFKPQYDLAGDPLGMALFNGVDVNVVFCPEIFTATFYALCETWAKGEKKFYVHQLPENSTESAVQTFNNTVKSTDKHWATKYLNWGKVYDGQGGTIWIPALGYYIGAGYVRVCYQDNNVAWSVPAGDRSYSVGVIEFSHMDLSDGKIDRYVTVFLTNVVKYVRNLGNVIWSSRTGSTNELYHSIHVRLETNWIALNLLDRNAKFVQRLNTPDLRNTMKVENRMWLKNIYDNGGIERSVPFDTAVVIEVTTNPTNRKNIDMDIAWIPPETTEFVKISLNRNDGILNIVE